MNIIWGWGIVAINIVSRFWLKFFEELAEANEQYPD